MSGGDPAPTPQPAAAPPGGDAESVGSGSSGDGGGGGGGGGGAAGLRGVHQTPKRKDRGSGTFIFVSPLLWHSLFLAGCRNGRLTSLVV